MDADFMMNVVSEGVTCSYSLPFISDKTYHDGPNCTRDSAFFGCDCLCSECKGFLAGLIVTSLIVILVILVICGVYAFAWRCLETLFKGCVTLGKCCFKLTMWCYSKIVALELEDEEELVPVPSPDRV